MEDVDPLNITGVDGRKERKHGKLGVDVTAVITNKKPFVVNGQPMKVSIGLR